MEGPETSVPLERLLAHRDWVRRVARLLVHDENEADDLEQEVWAEALENPPPADRSLRGWLAMVLRHDLVDRRRSEHGRRRREAARSRPEATPSAADLVAEADAHRRVVVAVMDLAEPYRSTVLYRFFQDLPPAAIAAREGIPVETVRTRLRRAVALLRERLDAGSAGGRGAWSLALLPLVHPPGVPAGGTWIAVGGVAMKASAKVAVLAALLLTGGILLWAFHEERPGGTPETGGGPVAEARRDSLSGEHPGDEGGPGITGLRAPSVPPVPGPAPAKTPQPGKAAVARPVEDDPGGPALPGEVAGRVLLLPDRIPVADSTIRLVGGGPGRDVAPFPDVTKTTTGPSGNFRLRGFAAGDYLFEASAPGHASRTFRATIPQGQGAGDLEVLLGSGGSIEGRVGLIGGAPAVGVQVSASPWAGGASPFETRTDGAGAYRFTELPPGNYRVQVFLGARRERMSSADVAEGKTARLDFPGGAALSGVVRDAELGPLADAAVRLVPAEGPFATVQARTDKGGAYRIEGVEPGEWKVGLQVGGDRGFSSDGAERVKLAEGENRVDLDLGSGALRGEVAGRVFAKATGQGIAGKDVQLALYGVVEGPDASGNSPPLAGMAWADAGGIFRFRALRPGRYRFWAAPHVAGVRELWMDLELLPGQRIEGLDAALDPAPIRERPVSVAFLSGAVRNADGSPVPGATVRAIRGGTMRQAGTDGIGQYRIEGLDPGEWNVQVQVIGAEGYVADAGTATVIAGENRFPIDLGKGDLGGEIAGKVVGRPSGRPLGRTDVVLSLALLVPDGKGNWTPGRLAGLAWPDAEGKFLFRAVRAGRLRIRVDAAGGGGGFRHAETDLDLSAGEKRGDLEIPVEEIRTGKVQYTVNDGEGRPIMAANFTTLRADGARDPWDRGCTSGGGGVYELSYEPGPRRIRVTTDKGAHAAEVDVQVVDGETVKVEVVLRPASEAK